MAYSAIELFNDWYIQGIKQNASALELSARKSSIDRILKYPKVDSWLILVKLFFGIITESSDDIKFFIDEVRKDDDAFPLKNNYNILRTIAGCAIAQKIEIDKGSQLSDALSIAIITTPFGDRTTEIPIADIVSLARKNWLERCVKVRAVDTIDTTIEFYELNTESIELTDDNVNSSASATNFNANNKKIKEYLESLALDTSNLMESLEELPNLIKNINNRLNYLSEESNIFWWLYNNFSRDYNLSFRELGLASMCVIAPKELADLTLALPGLVNANALLYKALQTFETDQEFSKLTFSSIIEASKPTTGSNAFTIEIPSTLEEITPCLYALSCYNNSEYDDSWKSIFKKKGKIKPNYVLHSTNFAEQVYHEILLVRVFNELK